MVLAAEGAKTIASRHMEAQQEQVVHMEAVLIQGAMEERKVDATHPTQISVLVGAMVVQLDKDVTEVAVVQMELMAHQQIAMVPLVVACREVMTKAVVATTVVALVRQINRVAMECSNPTPHHHHLHRRLHQRYQRVGSRLMIQQATRPTTLVESQANPVGSFLCTERLSSRVVLRQSQVQKLSIGSLFEEAAVHS